MNKLWKKALILGGIGFVIGILIGFGVYSISTLAAGGELNFSRLNIPELLVGGLYGMISMGSTVIYDIDSWSIVRVTVTHFVITVTGFHVMGIYQGWMQRMGWLSYGIMIACFVISYAIIWLSQYLVWRREVRRLNEDLHRMKEDGQKEE